MVRRHWAFGIVMAAGLTLRVLAQVAYQPALLYIDSRKYLIGSNGQEPEGYNVMLRLLDPVGGLGLVVAVQHLFGLALAATVYVLLIRYQAPRWVAAVAAAPVLLDAYQLQLEQTIMPDVPFEAVIGAGLAVLIWPRRAQTSRRGQLVAGALILGVATTIREIGGVLLVPVMVLAFLSAAGWRRVGHTALAAGCFLLPIPIYMVGYLALTGHFDLPRSGPGPEYGRAAVAADCKTLALPADGRGLCVSYAQIVALGGVDGLLHNPESPGVTIKVPPGSTRAKLLASFSLAVLRQQPLRVAGSVLGDAARLFALTRDGNPMITNIARWQFSTSPAYYPKMYPKWFYTKLDPAAANGDVVAVPALAQFLRDYQLNGGYTPGPLFLAGLILGAAGSLAGMVRRRTLSPDGARLARASLLVTLSAIVLLISSDAFEFSWRYQLPAVILLPLGGALGLAALRARCPNWTLGIRSRSADLQADQVGVHDAARSHTCHIRVLPGQCRPAHLRRHRP
jgi:hypothetical protein